MDLNGFDLNLLVAFDALMAERSVTRAGARIGRTQPAMSAALARLRGLFDDELFIRGPTGLQPTPRALDLAEPLSHALAEIQRTLDFTHQFDPTTSTASFTLGLPDHPAFLLLPPLAEALGARAPLVTLRIRNFIHRDEAVAILDNGEADLTISVPTTVASGGRILSVPLFEDRFVCILRRDHPAATQPLTLDRFLELPHLLVSPEGERYGYVDAALATRGLKRRLALTLPHMNAAPRIIAQSDMIATLLEGVVRVSGHGENLAMRPPPLALEPVTFVMSWHRRNDGHPAQRWLRSCLSDLAKDLP